VAIDFIGQGKHEAKGGDVFSFPGISPYQSWQQIGQAKQQQSDPWKTANGVLGNDGGTGWVHM
jgi:hypothetical protein